MKSIWGDIVFICTVGFAVGLIVILHHHKVIKPREVKTLNPSEFMNFEEPIPVPAPAPVPVPETVEEEPIPVPKPVPKPKPIPAQKPKLAIDYFTEYKEKYWKFHLQNECVFPKRCCDILPKDPGKYTCYGVAIKNNPEFYEAYEALEEHLEIHEDLKNFDSSMVEPLAQTHLFKLYYKDPNIIKIKNDKLRYAVYDYCIHSGQFRAIRALQKICGVEQDGILGPNTLEKCDDIPTKKYIKERHKWIKTLPIYKIYTKGMDNRIKKLRKQVDDIPTT